MAGALADRYFVRHLKRLLLLCLMALACVFALISLAMPPPPWLVANSHGGVHFSFGGKGLAVSTIAMSGLFAGACVAPAMELLAEAQVLSEGASANVTMLLIQIFAIAFTALVDVLAAPALHLLVLLSGAACRAPNPRLLLFCLLPSSLPAH